MVMRWSSLQIHLLVAALVSLSLFGYTTGVPAAQSARVVRFSGFTWDVKSSFGLYAGPGPSIFSADNVWIDPAGRLVLRAGPTSLEKQWCSSEVMLRGNLGYGTYEFVVDSPVNTFDPHIILGMYTWDNVTTDADHRELDVEVGRFGGGLQGDLNAQFVVQPFWVKEQLQYNHWSLSLPNATVHRFLWQPLQANFSSSYVGSSKPIASWGLSGSAVKAPGAERVHINLWLYDGKVPADGKPVIVRIRSFKFTPWPGGVNATRVAQ